MVKPGEAVVITKHQVESDGFQALYVGPARSYSVEGMRFYPGLALPVRDLQVLKRLAATRDFKVIPGKSAQAVKVGRLLERPHVPSGWEMEKALRTWSVEVIADGEEDVVVISPAGREVGARKVSSVVPGSPEEHQLQQEEAAEIEAGRRPYAGKLVPAGRGRWTVAYKKEG